MVRERTNPMANDVSQDPKVLFGHGCSGGEPGMGNAMVLATGTARAVSAMSNRA